MNIYPIYVEKGVVLSVWRFTSKLFCSDSEDYSWKFKVTFDLFTFFRILLHILINFYIQMFEIYLL